MNRPLFLLLPAACLGLGLAAAVAVAQPLILPGARFPDESEPGQKAPAGPAPTRAVGAKAVSEAAILDRDLRLNGSMGTLRLERAGRSGLQMRVVLQGRRLSRPDQACAVELEEPVAVTLQDRTDGLVRYSIAIPDCPVTGTLADGALWVREGGTCRFEAQDCQAQTAGLWGPEPKALAGRTAAIEQDRGRADRAVRENYRVLTQRAQPQDVRAIVSEQAAFSSEREMACRSFAEEASHGFCNARFTELRAAQLAARLGLAPAERPASPAPRTPVSTGRTERRPEPIRPPPASLLPSPR
jgi:hypothetical protein